MTDATDSTNPAGTPRTRRRFLATAATVTGATVAGATGTAALAGCSSNGEQGGVTANTALVPLADVPTGGAKAVTAGGQDVIVARPTETTAVAFSAVCTHQGCTVRPEADALRCPCHGSAFDTLRGTVRNGPADAPLTEVPVRVDGDNVVTA